MSSSNSFLLCYSNVFTFISTHYLLTCDHKSTWKQKLFISVEFLSEKEKSHVCQKQKKKKSVDKNKKTATAWTCIRPKMVTRNSSFFFLFRSFVILQFRARARLYRQESAQKKKTPKMYKEFKWFKVFRGAGFAGTREGDGATARLGNLLMKYFFVSFDSSWSKTRKTSNGNDFCRRTGTKGEEEEEEVFRWWRREGKKKYNDKPERTTSNEYYTTLGCPSCP